MYNPIRAPRKRSSRCANLYVRRDKGPQVPKARIWDARKEAHKNSYAIFFGATKVYIWAFVEKGKDKQVHVSTSPTQVRAQ